MIATFRIILLTWALTSLSSWQPIQAQQHPNTNPEAVLFTLERPNKQVNEVTVSEFVRAYEKHNKDSKEVYQPQHLNEYLDMYIDYKVKVAAAEDKGIGERAAVKAELKTYEKQLTDSYLSDKEITSDLLREAYDRLQEEVKVSHLLIMLNKDAGPNDTLSAYNRIMSIRNEIIDEGKNFETLARKHSQDPSVKDNGGHLGYITAFRTVYPFESAAYTTKVGEISKPVRTKYGYHLVKVHDKRAAQGEVEVRHILVKTGADITEQEAQAAKAKIDSYYKDLSKNPEKFEATARQYSDDKNSAVNGGRLPKFGVGRMVPEFEEAAFQLKEPGNISAPFKTQYGWHIVQLIEKHKMGDYKAELYNVQNKVKNDGRALISHQQYINRLKKIYRYKALPGANLSLWENVVDNNVLQGIWKHTQAANLTQAVFVLSVPAETESGFKQKTYTTQDFAKFIEKNQRKARSRTVKATLKRLYDMYVESELLAIEKTQLSLKNPEYAALLEEFRGGTLLFDLLNDEIWTKSTTDTLGLKKYYEAHKQDYQYPERAKAYIIQAKDKRTATKAMSMLHKNKSINEITKRYPSTQISLDNYEPNTNEMVDAINWRKGTQAYYNNPDGTVTLVHIYEVLPPSTKPLSDITGYVLGDYQLMLHDQFVDKLKETYLIKVNQQVKETLYR